jgi:hypothetical protein
MDTVIQTTQSKHTDIDRLMEEQKWIELEQARALEH